MGQVKRSARLERGMKKLHREPAKHHFKYGKTVDRIICTIETNDGKEIEISSGKTSYDAMRAAVQ